jgi:hypothetical protein
MNVLPDDAFSPAALLTLLALDGNPLATLPRKSFSHLNGTLRGLSLGGRFLECDCRLRWVAEWIRDTDLQVTSRERSPQFCGSPPDFRSRSFYQLGPDGNNPWFSLTPVHVLMDLFYRIEVHGRCNQRRQIHTNGSTVNHHYRSGWCAQQ